MTSNRTILESDEQALKNGLDEMYKQVSHALDKAIQSLRDCDVDIAAQVIAEDSLVNEWQHKIEEIGVQTIARQQPVAGDLRKLMTDIFISMELERIADHAVAIARVVLKLEQVPAEQYLQSISAMAEKCKAMLKEVMQAYDETDDQLARNVAAMDDEIDRAEEAITNLVMREISGEPTHNNVSTYLLWISHNLERIGDRITNIAERVIYMATSVTPELNR